MLLAHRDYGNAMMDCKACAQVDRAHSFIKWLLLLGLYVSWSCVLSWIQQVEAMQWLISASSSSCTPRASLQEAICIPKLVLLGDLRHRACLSMAACSTLAVHAAKQEAQDAAYAQCFYPQWDIPV